MSSIDSVDIIVLYTKLNNIKRSLNGVRIMCILMHASATGYSEPKW